MCVLAAIGVLGQDPPTSAALEGSVRDSRGKFVAAAVVQLKAGDQTLTARADNSGTYRFAALPAGTYTLSVEVTGQGAATSGPFVLAPKERRTIDLTLSTPKPEFFDEPAFIVAGVADSTSRGGHGSDAILRSSEELAKATASLGRESVSLAGIEEQRGHALEAAREYQRAAELDASERNLFDWAAELLAHRATSPAIQVFTKGNRLFPRSTRMLLGLAVAYYASGSYHQAAQRFFEATDLNPSDPSPYLFLGKAQSTAITESDGFVERMGRFAKLQPENAWANYYYACSLWKQKGAGDAASTAQVHALLNKAVRLDPKFAAAYLQLGIVHAEQKHLSEAISAYQKALELDPRMPEAHYRLAQAYAGTGEKLKAQKEFELHHQLAKESAEDVERERRQVQQFVIELRGRTSGQPQ